MKLGRIPVFDTRSKRFCVNRYFASGLEPISKEWDVPLWLDQGMTSSCVGHSWAHYLASFPDPITGVTGETAMKVYRMAQILDDLPGENYEGTSVLAGIKAVKALMPEAVDNYHWAFGLRDVLLAVSHIGPVVLGINWLSKMYEPDRHTGIIHAEGVVTGGHAILACGLDMFTQMVKLRNSWGTGWGIQGDCYISFSDLDRLLSQQGEAVVATDKHQQVIMV